MTSNPSRAIALRFFLATVCLVTPILAVRSAWAGHQVAVSTPAFVATSEKPGVLVIDFSIINTGVPINSTAHIDSITVFTTPVLFTDVANDVLMAGFDANDCGGELAVNVACTEQANYEVLDADPFDDDKTVDEGLWTAGINVNWRIGDVTGTSTGSTNVAVLDDVPEPSIWATMLVGVGEIGLLMRSRRRRGLDVRRKNLVRPPWRLLPRSASPGSSAWAWRRPSSRSSGRP